MAAASVTVTAANELAHRPKSKCSPPRPRTRLKACVIPGQGRHPRPAAVGAARRDDPLVAQAREDDVAFAMIIAVIAAIVVVMIIAMIITEIIAMIIAVAALLRRRRLDKRGRRFGRDPLQRLPDVVETGRGDRRRRHVAGLRLAEREFDRMLDLAQRFVPQRAHRPPELRQLRLRPAMEQDAAELRLDLADRGADAGLRHAAAICGAREMKLLAQDQKIPDVSQLHVAHPRPVSQKHARSLAPARRAATAEFESMSKPFWLTQIANPRIPPTRSVRYRGDQSAAKF